MTVAVSAGALARSALQKMGIQTEREKRLMEVHSTHISQNFLGYSRKTCTWEYPGDVCDLIDFMSEADRANANSNVGGYQCPDMMNQKNARFIIRIFPGCGSSMHVLELVA